MTNVTQAAIEAARERMAVAHEGAGYRDTATGYRNGGGDDTAALKAFALALQQFSDAIEAGDTSAFVLADPVIVAAREMLADEFPSNRQEIMDGGWDDHHGFTARFIAIRRGIAMAKAGEA